MGFVDTGDFWCPRFFQGGAEGGGELAAELDQVRGFIFHRPAFHGSAPICAFDCVGGVFEVAERVRGELVAERARPGVCGAGSGRDAPGFAVGAADRVLGDRHPARAARGAFRRELRAFGSPEVSPGIDQAFVALASRARAAFRFWPLRRSTARRRS